MALGARQNGEPIRHIRGRIHTALLDQGLDQIWARLTPWSVVQPLAGPRGEISNGYSGSPGAPDLQLSKAA
jgi:hypothetical protein